MSYHVFIDRPLEATDAGRARLAANLAVRFKVAESQLIQNLTAGRFRVKANADEALARKLAEELQSYGAIVSVEDAASGRPVSFAKPGVAPPAPAPAAPAAAPAAAPPPPARSGGFESGLKAAMAGRDAKLALGALERFDVSAGTPPPVVRLASLDGSDEAESEAPQLGAPVEAPSHSMLQLEDDLEDEPAKAPAAPAKSMKPIDLFAPPPADAEGDLVLAVSPARKVAAKQQTGTLAPELPPAPEHSAAASFRAPSAHPSSPSLPAMSDANASAPTRAATAGGLALGSSAPLARHFEGKPQARLIAGVGAALLIGYFVATLYAGSAEASRYEPIAAEQRALQSAVKTPEEWEALGSARQDALRRLDRARGRIRVTTFFLWASASSGLAWVWFRKLT